MKEIQTHIQKLLELTGLRDPSIHVDEENRKMDIFVNEGEWIKKWLPGIVSDLDHLAKRIAKKLGTDHIFIDVNNYRKERERIIVDLAKAAARKATTEKEKINLPAMNAYERRLVHVELSMHPDVETESEGEGKERSVTIKPIEQN